MDSKFRQNHGLIHESACQSTSGCGSTSSPTLSFVQRVRLSRNSCMMSVLSLYESSFSVSNSAIALSNACTTQIDHFYCSAHLFGQLARFLSRVLNFVKEDGEVECEAEADRVRWLHLVFRQVECFLICRLRVRDNACKMFSQRKKRLAYRGDRHCRLLRPDIGSSHPSSSNRTPSSRNWRIGQSDDCRAESEQTLTYE